MENKEKIDLLNVKNINSKIKFTSEINLYKNKNNNKCINEFEIINKISRGLIWKVYKVIRYFYSSKEDNSDSYQTQTYALKKSHIKTQKKRRYYIGDICLNYFDKMLEEVRILSKITEHPNIIKLYEIIYNPSHEFIYLVCEIGDKGTLMNKHESTYDYYHNYSLVVYLTEKMMNDSVIKIETEVDSDSRLIKRDSLSFEIKFKMSKILFKQIFTGLRELHNMRVAHRDIKLDNIVFSSKDDNCKLIDFSIATIVEGDALINEPGGLMHFQAPELFSQYNKNIKRGYYNSFKADIWSVGVSLYVFLFEKFPFDSDSELELQLQISNKDLDFDTNSCSDYIPNEVKSLLNKLLTKNPDHRLTDIEIILQTEFFN